MSKLQRKQVVLHLLSEYDNLDIQFAQHANDPDELELGTGVFLERQTWEDMGKPETITVTVELGDTING